MIRAVRVLLRGMRTALWGCMALAASGWSAATPDVGTQTAVTPSEAAVRSSRGDDKRPADQLTTWVFGRPLRVGGEYEVVSRNRKHFDLDDDELSRLDQEVQLELLYTATKEIHIFLEGKLQRRDILSAESGQRASDTRLSRGETWLYVHRLFASRFDLQIGRQNFRDRREWWWDADLDAIRVHYAQPNVSLELGLGEELGFHSTAEDIDAEEKHIRRILAHATWKFTPGHRLEAFALRHTDHSTTPLEGAVLRAANEDESDADLTWFGVRGTGRWKLKPGRFHYWFDYARVSGHDTVIDFDDAAETGLIEVDDVDRFTVRGWALDLGVTWQARRESPWAVTLGYAWGSGDADPNDGIDRSFRQTGLQDNNGKFRGVDRFRYYGELLRPELSNLRIFTMAVGRRLFSNSSVELAYHTYRQVEPAPFLRDARIGIRPSGLSRSIGRELDLVVGLEEWTHWEFELVLAVFESGDAYGEHAGDRAYAGIVKVNYNF